MASEDADGPAVPKGEQPNDEYRKVFGLFKYYHRAAMTLTGASLARAGLAVFGPGTVTEAWIDRTYLVLCIAGCGYVAAPYTRRLLEMLTLVRPRH